MVSSPAGMLQALMASAAQDAEARNQALGLLQRAPLLACVWPADASQLRTLTSSEGTTALPLFTDQAQLSQAAVRYGWLAADGSLPGRELSITEAVSEARGLGIGLIVLDLAADHALELDDGDMELLAKGDRRSSNPGVPAEPRRSSTPGSAQLGQPKQTQPSGRPRRPSSMTHLRPASVAPGASSGTVSATFGGSSQAQITQLDDQVPEAVTDALAAVLRSYPEAEWACLVMATRGGPGESAPAVGLRVDPNFRMNLNEIIVKLREAGIEQGATLDVLLLDEPETMRQARQLGLPFYPWKK